MPGLHVHPLRPADGPPLLLLHGVTRTGLRFRPFVETEPPGVRAIAPDLRGHGDSPRDAREGLGALRRDWLGR